MEEIGRLIDAYPLRAGFAPGRDRSRPAWCPLDLAGVSHLDPALAGSMSDTSRPVVTPSSGQRLFHLQSVGERP